MRRIPRKDANHKDVVAAFLSLGYSVLDLASVGSGCPDIAVGRAGITRLVEIKDGRKPPSERKLTDDQVEFRDGWRGGYWVCESIEDAVKFNRIWRELHLRNSGRRVHDE